jgi:hypothetical protein
LGMFLAAMPLAGIDSGGYARPRGCRWRQLMLAAALERPKGCAETDVKEENDGQGRAL